MPALPMRSLVLAAVLALCLSTPALAQDEDTLLPRENPAQEMLEPAKPEIGEKTPEAPLSGLNLETQPGGAAAATAIDPKDIPEILMKEVNEVERSCNYNTTYAAYHDCRCVAVKFLDARLKSDPDRPRHVIYQTVINECPNPPGIAGHIYQGCVDVMQYARPSDFEKFCTCTANDVAQSYKDRPNMNTRYIEGLRKRAMVRCGVGEPPAYKTGP